MIHPFCFEIEDYQRFYKISISKDNPTQIRDFHRIFEYFGQLVSPVFSARKKFYAKSQTAIVIPDSL